MLIDSHAHLDHERFAGELPELLVRASAAGIGGVLAIGIGDGPETMDRALRLVQHYGSEPGLPRLWASAGVHPQEAAACDEPALAKLNALLGEPEAIACGEIGLDFYHAENPPVAVQQEAFRAQMEVASGRRKPLLIHCRTGAAMGPTEDAWEQTLHLLETHWRPTGLGGILHCFSGDAAHAKRALDLGFLISFAGNLTYPSAAPLRDVAAALPLDALLVETDCPFLAPAPRRGQRNEPARMAHTAGVLAGLHGISPEALAEKTTGNFLRFFHLPDSAVTKATGATNGLRP